MGTETFWIPAVMSLVAAGGTAYNTKRTADKQDGALAAKLRGQADKQRQADARTSELVQKAASSDDTSEREGALASFMGQMQAQGGNATGGANVKGAVSDAYRQDAQDAALGAQGYGAKIADLLSRIDAPGQQRVNEAADAVRFGNEIDQIKRFSSGDDFLHEMRLRNIRRNPWIDLGAGALSGVAGAYGGKGAAASGGKSNISGINTAGSGTGWQGDSAFGAWGAGWD